MAPAASPKAPLTIRSTQRVSQLLTGRGTISVPTALTHAVSTSKPPATAATDRPASGTTINSPGDQIRRGLPGHSTVATASRASGAANLPGTPGNRKAPQSPATRAHTTGQ